MIKYGMLKEQFPDMSEEELRKMANIIRMACFAHIVGGLSEG
jgi:dsRNA-specific ribonuclease